MNNTDAFFGTPMFREEIPKWTDEVNKICDPYLKEIIEEQDKGKIGQVFHTGSLLEEPRLRFLIDYVSNKSIEFLNYMGYDLDNHSVIFKDFWVQEFTKHGGGHHRVHIHENCHISGFFFLKNENSSYPLFHDPRFGHTMSRLPEKAESGISFVNKVINMQPKPGTLILFPSYLPHEFVISMENKPFRFIHMNLQGIENKILYNEGAR